MPFPDKKRREWTTQEADEVVQKARALQEKFEIGQEEATWIPRLEREGPIGILLMTDTHDYSTRTNIPLINEHLALVAETPNLFMVHNGDNCDNFNIALGSWATGVYEDPLPPQIASRAHARKLQRLDDLHKIGALGFGNHDDFGFRAGQDWYDSFLGHIRAPVLTTGGLVHIVVGNQTYDLAMTHKYWGYSKLNPTNMAKRFQEHEYPDADIIFLGHSHQSEGLHFERGGKDRIAVIGGTYKDSDEWARKEGIGGRSGSPGWCVLLWPHERKMQLFRDVRTASDFLTTQ
jgi:predicted phosphodiesterase